MWPTPRRKRVPDLVAGGQRLRIQARAVRNGVVALEVRERRQAEDVVSDLLTLQQSGGQRVVDQVGGAVVGGGGRVLLLDSSIRRAVRFIIG